MTDFISTRFLVLRKTPYSDTSLVVAGISPEAGQLHFLVRGARRIGKKQFPVADLFRELAVQYRPGRGELYSWQSAELAEDFSGVAQVGDRFQAACLLARFALANLHAGIPHPRCYQALIIALRRLAAGPATGMSAAEATVEIPAALLGVALIFLDEHGLLSEFPAWLGGEAMGAQLLAMAGSTAAPPALAPEEWQRLRHWLRQTLQAAEFKAIPFV